MTFQQQVAVWLTLTVVSGTRDRSFVIVSLNWLVLAFWALALLVGRVGALVSGWARWVGAYPLGPRFVWGIG